MQVFVVRSDLAFPLLRPVLEGGWRWRGGVPVGDDWVTADLTISAGKASDFVAVDCMELISGVDGLILSDFARDRLGAVLEPVGEFWPVTVFERSYWWFNCLACVEALDREQTDADWSVVRGDWGSFSWITTTRRLSFQRARVAEAPAMFRIPEYPQGVLFCTKAMVDAVRAHELTGLRLNDVWSSDLGGVADPPGVSLAGSFDKEGSSELRRRRARALAVLARRRLASK